MMRNALILATVCAVLPGCLWMTPKSDSAGRVGGTAILHDDGSMSGGRIGASGGLAGLYVDLDAETHGVDIANRAPDDDRSFTEMGVALGLRASPLGILPTDHKLERWLDFGGEAGGNVGAVKWGSHYTAQSQGYYGGWLEVGTVKTHSGYLAIVGDVRRVSFAKDWRDETIISIGLAVIGRGLAGPIRD